jgi:hypothetical protein
LYSKLRQAVTITFEDKSENMGESDLTSSRTRSVNGVAGHCWFA